ncbi:hypothetical protein Rhe02_69260 [Rhizocola hellebori]|uniref:Uncharacterized protein n=1 Tax=Rhizocola hellebori TaxID=1392758 RepID=A0A8J3VIY2_9ACTN|nr:hypothetical protein Rhe02_69260 [Rhizocola hellebori]
MARATSAAVAPAATKVASAGTAVRSWPGSTILGGSSFVHAEITSIPASIIAASPSRVTSTEPTLQ